MFQVDINQAYWKVKTTLKNSDSPVATTTNIHNGISVFSNVEFTLPEHQLTTLCGVNGSGKSTLLSIMAGQVPAGLQVDGKVVLKDNIETSTPQNISLLNARNRAKQISLLVQNETNVWEITARKLVENGRYAHQKWYQDQTPEDTRIVDNAIAALGLTELQNRPISNLSGGELQRFRIARALAQQTPYIFLDEPLAGLDLNFQKELMQILKQLCQQGKTVCISIHDINLASTFADNLLMLRKDRNGIYQGAPGEIMRPDVISEVYGHGFELYTHPVTGAVQVW